MDKQEVNILIIDDDKAVLNTARMFLKQHFSFIQMESDPGEIPRQMRKRHYDLVLLDMNFSRGEHDGKAGLHWLKQILSFQPDAVVVLITAYGEVDLAVSAIKAGAADFVLKPWKNQKLLGTLLAALKLKRSEEEVKKLRGTTEKLQGDIWRESGKMIGQSPPIQRVFRLLEKVADTDADVLILGENGTGKELVARALHEQSSRRDQVFIKVDLGAIPETLFESELFGHVKGAFTDARAERAGSFELANKGTLFLDEIGNLSMPLQAKLLRVLQSRTVKRVGGNRETKLDIRLVCATNLPIYEQLREKLFRQDLLYRINTVEIQVPPLRERPEDIPLLLEHFLERYGKKYKRGGLKIAAKAMTQLMQYPWPGNVRELQHSVERAVILSEAPQLKAGDFALGHQKMAPPTEGIRTLDEMEKNFIRQAIQENNGNMSATARQLGLTRTALYRRLHKHGL